MGIESVPSGRQEPAANAGVPAVPALLMLDGSPDPEPDPATVILTCANCGALMDERKCKLICRCGYFLSCSDYY